MIIYGVSKYETNFFEDTDKLLKIEKKSFKVSLTFVISPYYHIFYSYDRYRGEVGGG